MKIAFAGCRHINIPADLIERYGADATEVLVGDCPTGVDACVLSWALERKHAQALSEFTPIELYHADWDAHGKGAGHIRNHQMVRDAEALVAFWDGKSPGTLSAIRYAVKEGVTVAIVPIGHLTPHGPI